MTEITLATAPAVLRQIADLLEAQQTTTTTTPQPVETIRFPTGPIKTRLPWGAHPSGIQWETIARWEPRFTNAVKEVGATYHPLLLACFAIIETGGQHYTTGLMTGTAAEVVRGRSDNRSVGILQIRADLHDPGQTWGALHPNGNILLGATLLDRWIRETGSWEAALAQKWHPGTDPSSGVDENAYVQAVRALIAEAKGETTTTPAPSAGKSYQVVGTARTVRLPFPLKQAIIPTRQTNQRPGIRMTPDRYVQHDTGNRSVGANALMHQRYLHNGAEGQQLSYHFTVDDREAWQMLPVNEVAWHGGDGDGPCNFRGLSCELCINADGNEAKARENAAILAAELMNALGINSLKKHQDCSGKWCPQDMLNEGYWPTFVQRVSDLRKARK